MPALPENQYTPHMNSLFSAASFHNGNIRSIFAGQCCSFEFTAVMRSRLSGILFLLLSVFVTASHSAIAQVNTEKLRRADSTTGVFFNTSLSFGIVRGNSEYVSVRGAARLDYARSENDNFAVLDYEFKESQSGKIANKGFLHLRSIWELSSVLSVEGFTQAEFNEFISLKNRDLIGAGARLHIFDTQDEAGRGILDLFLGVGAMFEHELYATAPADTRYNRIRSTNYLTVNWMPDEDAAFSLVGYVQPLIENPEDVRVTTESSLEFALTRAFHFHVSASLRYHSRPVLSVKRYDFELRNGIRLSLP